MMNTETLFNLLETAELRHQKMIAVLDKPGTHYYWVNTQTQGLLVIVVDSKGAWLVTHLLGEQVTAADWQLLLKQPDLRNRVPFTVSLPEKLVDSFLQAFPGDLQTLFSQGLWCLNAEDLMVPKVPGHFRCAIESDLPWLVTSLKGFLKEALPHQSWTEQDFQNNALRHLSAENLFLWCVEGQAVAMAAKVRETKTVAAVSLVYTVPDYRGKGFAAAVTAALSQYLLLSFRQCCLFTDLANPISGHVYYKIGYRQQENFVLLKAT